MAPMSEGRRSRANTSSDSASQSSALDERLGATGSWPVQLAQIWHGPQHAPELLVATILVRHRPLGTTPARLLGALPFSGLGLVSPIHLVGLVRVP